MNKHLPGQAAIDETWKDALKDEFAKPYYLSLHNFLVKERLQGPVYPPEALVFNAFNKTPFDAVKVVLLGQDPYHGQGQANGLCFSVSTGTKLPPSLKNIFKEMQTDLHVPYQKSGDLTPWAKQGVLLLNTTLTVREHLPASHKGHGWEKFTDAVISLLSDKKTGLVFILWGKHAQSKKVLIDSSKHSILETAHPSPLSVRKFYGCKHFSQTNHLLIAIDLEPINWEAID